MPKTTKKPQTIGELRQSGYKVISVKEEVRKNLIKKIVNNEELFPGIVGFDDSVIPQLENAILAGQDIILLGERGQAKSRLIRQIVSLLDEEIPVITNWSWTSTSSLPQGLIQTTTPRALTTKE